MKPKHPSVADLQWEDYDGDHGWLTADLEAIADPNDSTIAILSAREAGDQLHGWRSVYIDAEMAQEVIDWLATVLASKGEQTHAS